MIICYLVFKEIFIQKFGSNIKKKILLNGALQKFTYFTCGKNIDFLFIFYAKVYNELDNNIRI